MSISRAPSSARKTSYHHGDLRNALLAAARDLVAEAGIDGFGLREVSRRAGVSHTAAYNHFASRSALVGALVLEAFATLAAALRAAGSKETHPLARLQAIGVAYVRFAFQHPAEFRFMFRPELCPDPAGSTGDVLRTASWDAYTPLVEAIAACVASGSLVGDPRTLTLTAWSSVHGLASLIVDGPLRNDHLDLVRVEELARNVTSTLCAPR